MNNLYRVAVSIHAPVRGATYWSDPLPARLSSVFVSIHAPVRGGDKFLERVFDSGLGGVSIHAPVRGATVEVGGFHALPPVSIHAPCGGRRSATAAVRPRPGGFNPRPRAGGDVSGAS